MENYNNFQLNEYQLWKISEVKKRRKTIQYLQDNGIAPSDQQVEQWATVTPEDIQKYKPMMYAGQTFGCSNGNQNIPYIPPVTGNTEEENNEQYINENTTIPQELLEEAIKLTYFITDTGGKTKLLYGPKCITGIDLMEIDGVILDSPVIDYKFDTIGTHKVNIILKNSSCMSPLKFTNVTALREIVIPKTIVELEPYYTSNGLFYECQCIQKITCMATNAPRYDYDGASNTSTDVYSSRADADFYDIRPNGQLYVPKGCIAEYSKETNPNVHGWIGGFKAGVSGYNLNTYGWTIHELD